MARKLPALTAFTDYTNVIAGQGAVLQAEASSISDAAGVEQGLGLISAVNTQEDMSEQDAILAGALVSGSLTSDERVAFGQAAGRQQDDTLLYEELFTPAELKTYNDTMNALAPSAVQSDRDDDPAGGHVRRPAERDRGDRPDRRRLAGRRPRRGCTPPASRATRPRRPCSPPTRPRRSTPSGGCGR